MTIHRFGLISDTHGSLHPEVFDLFRNTEMILHAGDVVGEDILDELEVVAPTWAVQGNCDYTATSRLPEERIIEMPFGNVVIAHSHLIAVGKGHQDILVQHFAVHEPRLLLYGHTHQAYQGLHGDTWVLNPGAAGKPRFRDIPSVMVMEWDSESDEFNFNLVRLDWASVRSK